MISFPPIVGPATSARVQDVVRKAFALAVSAAELAQAVKGVFTLANAGTTVLTFGVDAPDDIRVLTPTRYLRVVETDGKVTTILGWR